MSLRTAAELAWERTEPVDPGFAALRPAPCETMHDRAGNPRRGVWRHVVDRQRVRLYVPGPNRIYVPGDGWIRPLEVLRAHGMDGSRPFCLHRNGHTGDYWLFEREEAGVHNP